VTLEGHAVGDGDITGDVVFSQLGTPIESFLGITAVETAQNVAQFTCILTNGDTYDIEVNGSHSLVSIVSGEDCSADTTVDVCLIEEGDGNQDGTVDGLDFSDMKASFLKSPPDPLFDPSTDYDDNGTVDGLDFSLLKGNFLHTGPNNC